MRAPKLMTIEWKIEELRRIADEHIARLKLQFAASDKWKITWKFSRLFSKVVRHGILLEFGSYLVDFSNVAPIEVAKALYTKLDSEEA